MKNKIKSILYFLILFIFIQPPVNGMTVPSYSSNAEIAIEYKTCYGGKYVEDPTYKKQVAIFAGIVWGGIYYVKTYKKD